jgi:hypothetical protein
MNQRINQEDGLTASLAGELKSLLEKQLEEMIFLSNEKYYS